MVNQSIEFVTNNPVIFTTSILFVAEFVLRKWPGAMPLTKLLYNALDKIVKDVSKK